MAPDAPKGTPTSGTARPATTCPCPSATVTACDEGVALASSTLGAGTPMTGSVVMRSRGTGTPVAMLIDGSCSPSLSLPLPNPRRTGLASRFGRHRASQRSVERKRSEPKAPPRMPATLLVPFRYCPPVSGAIGGKGEAGGEAGGAGQVMVRSGSGTYSVWPWDPVRVADHGLCAVA
eukprot:scaffold14669_cov72-Phaeocystis_antarctica.AAC.4